MTGQKKLDVPSNYSWNILFLLCSSTMVGEFQHWILLLLTTIMVFFFFFFFFLDMVRWYFHIFYIYHGKTIGFFLNTLEYYVQ